MDYSYSSRDFLLLLLSSLLFLSLATAASRSAFHIDIPLEADRSSDRLRLPSFRNAKAADDDDAFCESWKYAIETSGAVSWFVTPDRCISYAREYMTGDRYVSDYSLVFDYLIDYAIGVDIAGDGKDAWIFDLDETLLSNLPFWEYIDFGADGWDFVASNEWVESGKVPALEAGQRAYKGLQDLGFRTIIITARVSSLRNVTEENLSLVGYSSWDRLIMRDARDDRNIQEFKSDKRKELEAEGYRIHGNAGAHWNDLLGHPMATGSFKLPNPMLNIK